MKATDVLGSFLKGLAVIEAFSAGHDRLSITDAARATGLDRATARRCLLTLVEGGYAGFDGKFFSLTPRILRLGYSYLSSARLPVIVQPFLDRLMEETGQPASAGVLDGHHVVHIARAAQQKVTTETLSPGSRTPAYCSAMGRVLLAAMPDAGALALLRQMKRPSLTPSTVTDAQAIMEQVRLTRERGYGAVDREYDVGLCTLAVPIHDVRGTVIAALNIGSHVLSKTLDEMVDLHLAALFRERDAMQEVLLA